MNNIIIKTCTLIQKRKERTQVYHKGIVPRSVYNRPGKTGRIPLPLLIGVGGPCDDAQFGLHGHRQSNIEYAYNIGVIWIIFWFGIW